MEKEELKALVKKAKSMPKPIPVPKDPENIRLSKAQFVAKRQAAIQEKKEFEEFKKQRGKKAVEVKEEVKEEVKGRKVKVKE